MERRAPRERAPFGRLLALVFALSVLPATVRADPPSDVAASEGAGLPSLPGGFDSDRTGHVRWEYPSRAASIVADLKDVYREEWPRLTHELGARIDDRLVIRIGRNPEEMRRLAPQGAQPPSYASGVAYPARGLILLTLTAPETWERPDVGAVLVHELSHVALHRAVNGNEAPRWFSEGVAIHQAGERGFDRMRVLWSGTVQNRLHAMERLSKSFPAQPHRVNLAYAQSADFVRWLLARDNGEAKFREVISRMRRGQPFETALERTYATTMTDLELRWHESLSERFQAWPLLLGSGSLWVFAAFLIVIAYVRRKRRDRAKLREWDAEERAMLAAAQIVSRPARTSDDEREVLYVIPPEPSLRESGVPTVEHEGRSHTLH